MKSFLLICFCAINFSSFSQIVVYPQYKDGQRIAKIQYYEIEGKMNNNVVVFEKEGGKYLIMTYNDSMQLKRKVDLSFLPKETLSVNFFTYQQFAWIIYVYQKRKVLYCMAAKINGESELMNKPVLLDTTRVNFSSYKDVYGVFSSNKYIYGAVRSEDQSKILVFKKESLEDGVHFSRILFNNEMQLLNHSENFVKCQNEFFANFSVNNNGDWIFTGSVFRDTYYPTNIVAAQLFIQKNNEAPFKTENIPLDGRFLDQLILKIDNRNKHIVISSFYSLANNIDGLFTAIWDTENKKWDALQESELAASIKTLAKSKGENATALNKFYIDKLILRKNTGFFLVAEEKEHRYPTTLPDVSSTGLASEMPSYSYNNILILSVNNSGNLQWGNVIAKKQLGSGIVFSFGTVFREETLDFIYNEAYKQTFLMDNKSITFDGKVLDNPLMHGLRDNFILIPSRGKQLSDDEFVLPCVHKRTLYFTKIQF